MKTSPRINNSPEPEGAVKSVRVRKFDEME